MTKINGIKFIPNFIVLLIILFSASSVFATTIEWADFTAISVRPPINGIVSSSSGGLSFDVNFYGWSENSQNNAFGAGSTTNGILDWGAYSGLHGIGGTSYGVEFDNIYSHDDSLYFAATWLNAPVTIRAYDISNQQIDLSGTSVIDTWYGNGPTSWNGASGQLRTYNGYYGAIVDLSGLSIDRIALNYNTGTWDGFGFGIANNKIAPVPEPATMLLLGTGLVGLAGTIIKRKKK